MGSRLLIRGDCKWRLGDTRTQAELTAMVEIRTQAELFSFEKIEIRKYRNLLIQMVRRVCSTLLLVLKPARSVVRITFKYGVYWMPMDHLVVITCSY